MDNPASFEVTRAPAMSRRSVQNAVKTAYRCMFELCTLDIIRAESNWIPDRPATGLTPCRKTLNGVIPFIENVLRERNDNARILI
jgi:hypothetical protein